ncbi:MAG: hypothetical protein A2Y34_15820 [Spirochaetes bacterium GWC1_27_15]|nr:MAG: hypothetical protein A2Z98_04455 [Spirochaetes bacterium GWB1_27_13]OHD27338.1 MAG: hypothetical protein A2Y34_15820 [Spirochaetes bacterium GWC1_27_15]
MQYGIIALTKGGVNLAKKIKSFFLQSDIFTLPKLNQGDFINIEENFADFVGEIFTKYKTLIFIMATGIVVRSVAKYIRNKTVDPAIVVIDEAGQFVISLLSGHIGGANDVAKDIAQKIGATPVITTASDVQKKISVDMLAKKYNLIISSMDDAKKITSLIVNNEPVFVESEIKLDIPDYLKIDKSLAKGLICVTNKDQIYEEKPFVKLIPQNIILGIGCKKDVSYEKMIKFVENELKILNIDKKSIKYIATIDIKKEEKAILELAKYLDVQIVFFMKEDIEEIEANFSKSEFVKKNVGVSNVCETTAFLASARKGKFLLNKKASDGITLAITQMNMD